MEIGEDDLGGADIAALIGLHVNGALANSPPGSCHAMGIAALRRPEITVWTARQGGELLGCAALRELDARHGEIKSMRVVAGHLRQGVARALLAYIIAVARGRGYRRLSLETGTNEAFAAARTLYAGFGFEECGPFGEYEADTASVFLTLEVTGPHRPQLS